MPEIVQGNRRVYCESHGSGIPLILIRGLGSNADHWYPQLPDLSRHYRVITFDNRGIARSSDPGGPFTIKDPGRPNPVPPTNFAGCDPNLIQFIRQMEKLRTAAKLTQRK